MNYHINEAIFDVERIFPKHGRHGYHRFDMNENPEGLPDDFVEEVRAEITPEFLAMYPEPVTFLQKYAEFLSMENIKIMPENIMVNNGSGMAIRYAFEAFGEKDKEVVTVSPSFEMYRVNCGILGYKHIPVNYEKDMTIDIHKIINAISEDTRIVVLLNPNNPIGNVYTREEVISVINRAEQVGAVVIIDEAYHYFYETTFLDLSMQFNNVLLLRSFSKLMSLAACRIGVAIGNPEIIWYAKKAMPSYEVNSIALLFATRLLERPDIITKLINSEKEGKAYLLNVLRKNEYWCMDCKGNFIFVKPHHDALVIAKRLKTEKKVLVHAFTRDNLSQYLRVSTGSVQAVKIFIDAFLELDA